MYIPFRSHISKLKQKVILNYTLSPVGKRERTADHAGRLHDDPGPEAAIAAACDWILSAQNKSQSQDGGVARDFSLLRDGWANSYPETTGYIIPTFLREAQVQSRPELHEAATRMLDWLVSIQFPEGGFQGGKVGQTPCVPVTFNTGQILLGLAAGVQRHQHNPSWRKAMILAANWLRDTQDADGCWRKHATPFAAPGDKSYETHVSWGLLEAARVGPDDGWSEAALKQVRWAMTKQTANGWMNACCLIQPDAPLTHTLGYCLKGFMEAWLFSQEQPYLDATVRLATPLREALDAQDRLPGRLDENWQASVPWVCLTGQVQISWVWLALYEIDGDAKWLEAAKRANRFVRRTIRMDGPDTQRGGVKGSYPVDGGYGCFEYLNWAAKFAIDAFRKELSVEMHRKTSET